MDARRSFERLFNSITDVARRWAARLRQKPTETVVPPAPPVRLHAKPEAIPADPEEHAVQFAQDWYDRLELHARRRMRELSIPEHSHRGLRHRFRLPSRRLLPKRKVGWRQFTGARINLNSGILNPELLAPKPGAEVAALWAKGRLRDRMDAIIVHEDIEGLRVAAGEEVKAAHAVAVALAPDTPRLIREGARRILRAIREHELRGASG